MDTLARRLRYGRAAISRAPGTRSMRFVIGLSLMLLGAIWLASTLGLREPVQTQAAHWKQAQAGTQWRRTAHGWQRVDRVLNSSQAPRLPLTPIALDPLVVATLQLLISVLALIAFPVAITSSTPAHSPSMRKTRLVRHSAQKMQPPQPLSC